MAIVQASLNEEILNRQERAIIRGIYRAAQLHEGLVQLEKIYRHLAHLDNASCATKVDKYQHINSMIEYLSDQATEALNSTKLPAKSRQKVTPSFLEAVTNAE